MKPYLLKAILMGTVMSVHSVSATAKNPSHDKQSVKTAELNVRAVKDSSVDLFDVLSHIPRADTAFADGDYALAFQHYRYVYLHDPKHIHSALGYADSALALAQTALASQIYDSLPPDNLRAQNGKLLIGIIEETIENPEAQLKAQLEIVPDDARLWNMLGQVLDQDNRGNDARAAYASAQKAGQRAGLAANNIGQSFLKEGLYDKAQIEFTRASLEAPQTRLFDNNRRLTLLLRKNYADALMQLDKDRSSQLLKDAALIAAHQGERKLAIYFLEKSIALNPVYDFQTVEYLTQLSQ